ncbi:MAG: PfkB family carbohydrate kinase [Armatimonadota bacterium]|nr:PfkB family carbohydrate kinase [Armatimonadota bacterium]MDW8157004.1 PfkB family carbohydrate kinase [Armatimonadota bacterium]
MVKLGEQGALYACEEGAGPVPVLPVQAVDTTAAGDTFAAALGMALAEGRGFSGGAVRLAVCAAGVKVTRLGAQSMPYRGEVDAVLGNWQGTGAAPSPASSWREWERRRRTR